MKLLLLGATHVKVLASVVGMLSGCATMMADEDRIVISSRYPDAKLYVNDEYLGRGDAETVLGKGRHHVIIAKKKGCKQRKRYIQKKFHHAGWFFLNCLITPLLHGDGS